MCLTLTCVLVTAAAALSAAAPVPKHLMPAPGGWKKLESGVEVWDVKEGKGEAVKPGATVTIHYTGWLTDEKATKFDSSVDRGEKVEFALGSLIKGWQDGVPGMRPGGVRRLRVPPELGYGARGAGATVPPNATLVFEIELFEAK